MFASHGVSVLVTDGRKALLLRNQGDPEFPNLQWVRKWEHASPSDRSLKVAAPGRSFSSIGHGSRRSAYSETDFHTQAEAGLASSMADHMNRKIKEGTIESLIIVAPPRTLAVLRNHLSTEASSKVTGEIAKDLVKHPIADIERILAAYREPPRQAASS